ncbi:hypothetical protein [Simplicispira metamorpha]|uniref:hypothetical protein n=1 Tax=Simplicispira metamorpha TaxID=80881 RepID=UPI0013003D54|nr:hypothetical protein [Simplicispira metamorpha]
MLVILNAMRQSILPNSAIASARRGRASALSSTPPTLHGSALGARAPGAMMAAPIHPQR